MNPERLRQLIKMSVEEDIGSGDITTEYTIPADRKAEAVLSAKEDGIIYGIEVLKEVYSIIDDSVVVESMLKDGDKVEKGDKVLIIKGNARSILSGERLALNFMQRLSGVATTANRYASEIKEYKAKVLDTRKTTPGFRELEKHAVRVGGAENHRKGLYDMILIKDNHIKVAGGIKEAVAKVNEMKGDVRVEVEVASLDEFREALETDVDWIMLDNMPVEDMRRAVESNKGKILEASGGITLENIKETASTGVDYISVGALTHSYKSLDLSINVEVK